MWQPPPFSGDEGQQPIDIHLRWLLDQYRDGGHGSGAGGAAKVALDGSELCIISDPPPKGLQNLHAHDLTCSIRARP